MTKIRITTIENSVAASTPYHSGFVEAARKLAGKWDSKLSVWLFPASQETRVRDLCKSIFGTDGSTGTATCTLRVALDKAHQGSGRRTELYVCGRQVARVFGRDSGAKLGDLIVVVEGDFYSGGSRAHPALTWDSGTVIEVLECPVTAARQYIADNPDAASILGETAPAGDNVITFNPGAKP